MCTASVRLASPQFLERCTGFVTGKSEVPKKMRTKPRRIVLVLLVLAVVASFVATNATFRMVTARRTPDKDLIAFLDAMSRGEYERAVDRFADPIFEIGQDP